MTKMGKLIKLEMNLGLEAQDNEIGHLHIGKVR